MRMYGCGNNCFVPLVNRRYRGTTPWKFNIFPFFCFAKRCKQLVRTIILGEREGKRTLELFGARPATLCVFSSCYYIFGYIFRVTNSCTNRVAFQLRHVRLLHVGIETGSAWNEREIFFPLLPLTNAEALQFSSHWWINTYVNEYFV